MAKRGFYFCYSQKYAAFASTLQFSPVQKIGVVLYLAYFCLLFATLCEVGQT